MASFPFEPTQERLSPSSPHLSYQFHTDYSGKAELELLVSPTLDFRNSGGLRFAVSVDDQPPRIINMHRDTRDDWGTTVSNNVTSVTTSIGLAPGNHTLKIWALETGVILQKIIIWTGERKESYLGPPESGNTTQKNNRTSDMGRSLRFSWTELGSSQSQAKEKWTSKSPE